ncbi:MAG: YdcF family protein [Hyphomonadaceae bacterium]
MKLFGRILFAFVLIGVVIAGWDFLSFVGRAETAMTPPDYADAEAVAALTGASDKRIIEAVQLAQRKQLPLVISGVHVDTSVADIARIAGVDELEIACCVTLGHAAASTEGNGDEIADWARKLDIKRIIVVTSEYHMDRALLELRRAMPDGVFYPHAVSSMRTRPALWYQDANTADRLVREWLKYRLAELRIGVSSAARRSERT